MLRRSVDAIDRSAVMALPRPACDPHSLRVYDRTHDQDIMNQIVRLQHMVPGFRIMPMT